ncbi:MAG: glycosyltransferase [Gemmatimonadaceae bacterium]|nr:glycosyltransferase [Gemmatimonadaceae bacterium]
MLRDSITRRLRSALDLFRYNAHLARLMKRENVSAVYCNSIRSLLLAGVGARMAGVPALWYVKGALDNPLLDTIGFLLASRIAFFCETNRDDRYPLLVRLFRKRIRIIEIGLDRAVIDRVENSDKTQLREELDIRPERLNAIVLGQVYAPKGQHFVLEGMREIVNAYPNFMLYIAGDAVLKEYESYTNSLHDIIKRDGLENNVRFLGWRTDALELLTLMDIMIHPSLAEGFGRAVLEAMAVGRPVVASRVGGLREIIRDGENGFLITPGSTHEIVDRVLQLAGDPALREKFSRAAKREVMANYLIEDKVKKLESLWLEMAAS